MRRRRRLHRRERKHRNKKIIISMFALVLFLSCGYAAFQTNINLTAKGTIYKSEDKCYTILDNGNGTCTITDYDKSCGTDVVIPETIKGMTVTKIGDTEFDSGKVFNEKGLISVVIPDTVTYIGKHAFWNNGLKNVKFGESVEEIGAEAFGVNELTELDFPSSLKKINDLAFYNNCLSYIPSLTNIEYGSGTFARNCVQDDSAFVYKKNEDGSIDYTNISSFARKTIDGITFPSTVKTIGKYSMRGAIGTTLTLPSTIECLEHASLWQTHIEIINIPSSVKTIGSSNFDDTVITTINIDRKENAIEGAPWGATNTTINWTGTE